ncbi:MAG TPA: CBS domain-containing protein [Conexibacter sp.]|jgi:CBS domain-containing protein|nr:CBS domain-containing protein [Conexibacter sp.]
MPTVADIMERDPVTVTPEDTVETLLRTLREHELPGVPVVNGGGRCVGIVTESDLVLVDEEEDLRLPLHIDLFGGTIFLGRLKPFEDRVKKAIASTVADMMTSDPTIVAPDTDLHEAARLIAEHRHNRLPVVEHGRLVGVVTRLDVLEALVAPE